MHLLQDADEFVCGGAVGSDIIAFNAACSTRQQAKIVDPESKLARLNIVAIVAATLGNQPWEAQQAIIPHIGRQTGRWQADVELIELGLPYNAESLKHRNHVMIDRILAAGCTGQVLAYWREGVYRSGTWSAIHYAQKHGVLVEQILRGGSP